MGPTAEDAKDRPSPFPSYSAEISNAIQQRRMDFALAGEHAEALAYAAACTAMIANQGPGATAEQAVRAVHVTADALRGTILAASESFERLAQRRHKPPAVLSAADLAFVLGTRVEFAESLIASGRMRVMEHDGQRFVLSEDLAKLFERRVCGDCSRDVTTGGERLPSGFYRCAACAQRFLALRSPETES